MLTFAPSPRWASHNRWTVKSQLNLYMTHLYMDALRKYTYSWNIDIQISMSKMNVLLCPACVYFWTFRHLRWYKQLPKNMCYANQLLVPKQGMLTLTPQMGLKEYSIDYPLKIDCINLLTFQGRLGNVIELVVWFLSTIDRWFNPGMITRFRQN